MRAEKCELFYLLWGHISSIFRATSVNLFTLRLSLGLANCLELIQYFATIRLGMVLDTLIFKRLHAADWWQPGLSCGVQEEGLTPTDHIEKEEMR